MRILLSLIAGVLMMSTGVISSADRSDAMSRLESQTPAVKAAARKAWPAFFAEFRAAVRKRDRNALTKMMAKDFNGPPHTVEEAFKQWDDPKFAGLDEVKSGSGPGRYFGWRTKRGRSRAASSHNDLPTRCREEQALPWLVGRLRFSGGR